MPVVRERKHGFAEPTFNISVGRHGWQEQGGRQVGVYGQAWHEGECFGVGWLPFEISDEGTRAYIESCLYEHALGLETALWHYAARPAIVIHRIEKVYVSEHRGYVHAPYDVRVRPGSEEQLSGWDWVGRNHYHKIYVPSYEDALSSAISERRLALDTIRREALDCYARIAAWKWETLRDEKRVATVHFQRDGARLPFCGTRSHGLHTTDASAETTCSRCLKALAAEDARVADDQARKADGIALAAWLRERAKPAAVSEIKKQLGWDIKRINNAYDAAQRDGTVARDWTSTKTIYVAASPRSR